MWEEIIMYENIKGNLKVSRYIVPFSYVGGYIEAVDRINEDWELTLAPKTEQDIYEYVASSLYLSKAELKKKTSSIGSLWSKRKDGSISFPSLGYKDSADAEIIYPIIFKSMGMSLFRNGLGFIWYDVMLMNPEGKPVNNTNIIVNFHNRFKELNLHSNTRRIIQISDVQSEPFMMGQWINQILLRNFGCVRFYPGRLHCKDTATQEMVPDKAVLFNYYIIYHKEDMQLQKKLSMRLSSGYNTKYKVSTLDDSRLFMPFENVYWNICKEGCGCCVSTEGYDSFFEEIFPNKVLNDYFTLYLLLLYQSYSLLIYAERIETDFSADSQHYLNNKEYSNIQAFLAEMNTFMLKSTHVSVSHIQHQNDFYNYGMKELRIYEDIKSVMSGADTLGEMQKLVENHEKEDRDSKLNTALALLAIWTLFSAITDGLAFVDWIFFNKKLLSNPFYCFVSILIGVIIFTIGIIALSRVITRKNKKNKKKGIT